MQKVSCLIRKVRIYNSSLILLEFFIQRGDSDTLIKRNPFYVKQL